MTEDEHIFTVAACLREIRGSHTDAYGRTWSRSCWVRHSVRGG